MELLSDINGELIIACAGMGLVLGWIICYYQFRSWYYTIPRRPDKEADKMLKIKMDDLKREFLTPDELKDEGL
jgi:hypothetical protein